MSGPQKPARTSSRLTYRPALDGLRGVAVLAVLLFHLWPSLVPGGWLGVDLFFVLSGFLITSLLVREFAQTGRIDLLGFWAARMRRLLPSLLVVLLAVAGMMALWTVPQRRSGVGLDMLAALAYVANWRLLGSNEAYFAGEGTPSPLRHTWSLGIEEQYYVLFPLIFLLLTRFVHRRRHLAWVFLAVAALSAAWMAHLYVPDVDPTRVYYGTDTRAFELLIGAFAGAWVGPRQWGNRNPARWASAVERCAWPALLGLVWAFFAVHDDMGFLYRGGLALLCFIVLVPILTAASPYRTQFQRALAWEPLRQLGLISYALYLWHWPIHVFLTSDRLHVSDGASAWIQALLSLVLAALTYRYVEQPIRERGVRHLISRPGFGGPLLATATVATVIVAAAGLPHLAPLVKNTTETGASGGNLVVPSRGAADRLHANVLLLGNSIPSSLKTAFPQDTFPNLDVQAAVSFGCTPYAAQGDLEPDGSPRKILPECAAFQRQWPTVAQSDQQLVYFVPQNLLYDHSQNGTTLKAGTPAHDTWVASTLTDVQRAAQSHGIHHIDLVNLACHRMPTFGQKNSDAALMNDTAKVRHLNSVVASWSRSHSAGLFDQYSFLCPSNTYHGRINGADLYSDALHFTDQSGPLMWTWLATQLQKQSPK